MSNSISLVSLPLCTELGIDPHVPLLLINLHVPQLKGLYFTNLQEHEVKVVMALVFNTDYFLSLFFDETLLLAQPSFNPNPNLN